LAHIILGFGYDALTKTHTDSKWFVFLYCLANFFQNFGPNTTTFIVPGEAFPTRYRSTAHGMCAASGKLGAVVAQVGFAQLRNIGGTNKFVNHMYVVFLPSSEAFGYGHLIPAHRQPRNFCLLHADWNLLHVAYS
jgi:PHS family inorganic phosphate transporter-like MFS transporter